MSVEELKKFYKSKVKNQKLFTYDVDGNLVELDKNGSVVKTIPLPDYRAPTFEEFDEMEQKRSHAIALANKEYENARRELRTAVSKPGIPDSEIIRLNRKIKEADIKLLNTRYADIYVSYNTYSINQLDFTNPSEKRKYPYYTFSLQEAPFKLQEQYVRVGKPAVKPFISVAEAKVMETENNSQVVILFAEPETNDYGFMSLKWAVELEMNGTSYNSAQQALAAELAKSFNDTTNLQKIMLAETPDEISYNVDDVPGEANDGKWNDLSKRLIYDINIAKFNQYPELKVRLLETRNAVLGAYIPNDTLIGIGISLDNFQSKNPINWTGQNILGKALMDIREKIRVEREIAAQQMPQPVPKPSMSRKKPVIIQEDTGLAQPTSSIPQEAIGVPRKIRRKPAIIANTEL